MNSPITTNPITDPLIKPLNKLNGSGGETSQIEAQSLYALIARQAFFKGLNAGQLQLLADSAIEMHFDAGQTIFQEGSPANRFYLILEGSVLLESEMADHNSIPIQLLPAACC